MANDAADIGQVRVAHDARGRRTTFEELEIGKDLGTAEYFVTQSQIDQTCFRLGDLHPYFQLNSPFGGTVAPVYMSYKLTRVLFSQTYSVRGLFYKWGFEFFRPIKVDVKHTVQAVLTEKWIKNDREFVAYESVCKDDQGNVVFKTRRAHVLDFIKRTAPKVGVGIDSPSARTPEGKAASELYWDPNWINDSAAGIGTIEVEPLATLDTGVGAALPQFACHFNQAEFDKRWGWTRVREGANTTLHYDHGAARAEGLKAPIAGGPDVIALILCSALHFFGKNWVSGAKGDLTVARPTFLGDYVVSKGRVIARELLPDGSARLSCEVWVEGHGGDRKITGTLSGIVSAA